MYATEPPDPGRVEDSLEEQWAQRTARDMHEAAVACRGAIRFAQEHFNDYWLQVVKEQAMNAFHFAGELLAERYCDIHQKPLLRGEYGYYASNCEDCEPEERTFDEALGFVCDAREREYEALRLKR
jgi:hypothetical protein